MNLRTFLKPTLALAARVGAVSLAGIPASAFAADPGQPRDSELHVYSAMTEQQPKPASDDWQNVASFGAGAGGLDGGAAGLSDVPTLTRKITDGLPGASNASPVTMPAWAASLPFVTVSAHGIADGSSKLTNDGATFGPDYPGGTDASLWIQTAIDTALNLDLTATNNRSFTNAFGGAVYFYPGVFHCQSQIVITNVLANPNQRIPVNLILTGAGRIVTRLNDEGARNSDFITTLLTKEGGVANTDVYIYNLWLNRVNFAQTCRMSLLTLGCVNHFEIANCAFTSEGAELSGGAGAGLQASYTTNLFPTAITALTIKSHWDNLGVIRENIFFGFGNGIDGSWDHIKTDHNTFASCGSYDMNRQYGAYFPTNDIRCIGACIINRGGGGGRFYDDHCFADNAYMVKQADNLDNVSPSTYGHDIVSGTMFEQGNHVILDLDNWGILTSDIVVGSQSGRVKKDGFGDFIIVEGTVPSPHPYTPGGSWSPNSTAPTISFGGFSAQSSFGAASLSNGVLVLSPTNNVHGQHPGSAITINLPGGNTNDILEILSNNVVQMKIDRYYNLTTPGALNGIPSLAALLKQNPGSGFANSTAPGAASAFSSTLAISNVLVTTAFVTNSPYVVSTNTHVVNFYFTNGLIVLPSNSPAGLFYTIASMNTNGSCTVSNPLGNCLLPGIGISNVFQLGGANSPSNTWSGASLGDQNFN